jgi:hypothetical protein
MRSELCIAPDFNASFLGGLQSRILDLIAFIQVYILVVERMASSLRPSRI